MRFTVPKAWRRVAAALAALAVAVVLGDAARGETFLLKDGSRVVGRFQEEFKGPDKSPWVRVRTPFGTTQFARSSLKKEVKADAKDSTLLCASIIVTTLKGTVEISGDDGAHWTAISPRKREGRTVATNPINEPNTVVAPGHEVRTGSDGEIDLDLGWGVVHVAPSSRVAFRKAGTATMTVHEGRAGARLDELPKDGEFRVETPQASMGVRGTTFSVAAGGDAASFAVEKGTVAVGERPVAAGRMLTVRADGGTAEGEPDGAALTIFDRLKTTFAVPRIDRVRVPAGEFEIRDDTGTWDVRVPAFELARTEVTQAQFRVWAEWMAATDDHWFCHPDEPPGISHGLYRIGHRPQIPEEYYERQEAWAREHLGGDDQPVVGMSWFTAYSFCAWIGARLPSYAKMRWAIQGAAPKPDGSATTVLAQSWVRENSGDMDRPAPGKDWPADLGRIFRTHPVATRAPNRLGLHDILGNAKEWLQDHARAVGVAVPRDGSPYELPPDPSTGPESQGAGGVRYFIGGCFDTPAGSCVAHSENSYAMTPTLETGFRPEFRGR